MTRRNFIEKLFKLFALGLLVNTGIPKFTYAKEIKATPNKPNLNSWKNDELSFAWIGHSSFLINFYGTIILTDIVLSNRIGVYFLGTNWGPQRLIEPALKIDELPKPDLILLTHAHLDHMDYPTLKAFSELYPNQIDVITAFKTKDVIENLKWKSLTEIDWDENLNSNGLQITAFKSKHFGWRFPWEKDRSKGYVNGRSYNTYIIEKNNKTVLFSCDINFTDLYKPLKSKNIDVILMPIGAYNPWRFTHCNPQEAYQMATEINAKYFIPMHTRTFPQGKEPYDEAITWLKRIEKVGSPKVVITEIGQTFSLS